MAKLPHPTMQILRLMVAAAVHAAGWLDRQQ
jgi:hypothetical protein